jgi:hypothetical protein
MPIFYLLTFRDRTGNYGLPTHRKVDKLVKARFSPDVNQDWYRLLRMLGTKYRSKISQNIPKEAKKHFVQPNTD